MAIKTPITGAPTCAPDPVVAAYLAAKQRDDEIDRVDGPESVELRLAQFAARGAEDYILGWGLNSTSHAALVALLGAKMIEDVVGGRSQGWGENRTLSLGYEEMHEIGRIQAAFLKLAKHLDDGSVPALTKLVDEIGGSPVNLVYSPARK